MLRISLVFAMGGAAALAPISAKSQPLQPLQAQLNELKAAQARINAEIVSLEARLLQLEDEKADQTRDPGSPTLLQMGTDDAYETAQASVSATPRLRVSGDLRLRYENNSSERDAPVRNRGVVRARLRAAYEFNRALSTGVEIVTGDADDPNTADLTISEFADDIEIALSQAWMRYKRGGVVLIAGKFPNPFRRTDLVWDGDVNPQGAAASYTLPLGAISLKATGLYFLIDENALGADSRMAGEQVTIDAPFGDAWRLTLSEAYYDYTLNSLDGADAGDFRSNLRNGAGGYVSDFDLVNITGELAYYGIGTRWPVRLQGDYVTNLGAMDGADTGYSAALSIGRVGKPRDWRFSYGYQQAEVDAVLAAFSHDNLALATNYKAHHAAIDFSPVDHLSLNATVYFYRPLDPAYAAPGATDWRRRLRLNATVEF